MAITKILIIPLSLFIDDFSVVIDRNNSRTRSVEMINGKIIEGIWHLFSDTILLLWPIESNDDTKMIKDKLIFILTRARYVRFVFFSVTKNVPVDLISDKIIKRLRRSPMEV